MSTWSTGDGPATPHRSPPDPGAGSTRTTPRASPRAEPERARHRCATWPGRASPRYASFRGPATDAWTAGRPGTASWRAIRSLPTAAVTLLRGTTYVNSVVWQYLRCKVSANDADTPRLSLSGRALCRAATQRPDTSSARARCVSADGRSVRYPWCAPRLVPGHAVGPTSRRPTRQRRDWPGRTGPPRCRAGPGSPAARCRRSAARPAAPAAPHACGR